MCLLCTCESLIVKEKLQNGRGTTPFTMLAMEASKKRHMSRRKKGSACRRVKRKGTTVALPKTARKKRAKAAVKGTVAAVEKMQGVKLFLPRRHKEMMLVKLWVVTMVRVFIVHAPVFLAQFYRHAKRATIVVMMGEEHQHKEQD